MSTLLSWFSPKRKPHTLPSLRRRYLVALCLLGVAFALRWILGPVLGDKHPYLLFIPAALIAAWYGRFGPAMLVLGGGYVLGDFFFHAPIHSFGPYSPEILVTILGYVSITLIGVGILETFHRTQDRLQLSEEYRAALEREIHERHQAQHALEKSEHEYRILFESNPLPTWVFDREKLTFMAVNQAMVNHYGYTREEFLRMSVLDIRPPEEAPALREYIRRSSGELLYAGIWKHRKRNGTLMEVEITGHPLRFAGRDAIMVVANDVTERRRAERELHQAQVALRKYADELELRVSERTASLETSVKSLEGVLYHVAHDLRGPLRAMNGFTQLLVNRCGPDPQSSAREFGQRILEASELMDEKIHDLIEFGRLGHLQITWGIIDLAALARKLWDTMGRDVKEKQAELTVDEPLPEVVGDAQLLDLVLSNLLSNALMFVSPGTAPKIYIGAEQSGQTVRLYIQDNGIGIDPKYHEKVFGIFEQLHEPGAYPGTGMGLAIAKKAMERMGGRIGLESEPGHGSRFWIELKPAPLSLAHCA